MSIPYENKKKLIESAKELKEYCRYIGPDKCEGCLFLVSGFCELENVPNVWKIPKLSRWTPEDVALAKALKSFGADYVYKYKGRTYWKTKISSPSLLPCGAFDTIQDSDGVICLETIIEEAEV